MVVQEDILQTVLKDSRYSLSLFDEREIKSLRDRVFTKPYRGKSTPFVTCVVRDKDVQLKPEEVVRQLYAARLIDQYGYPKKRLSCEHPVNFGRQVKRADIVISDKDRPDSAYVIIEVKKPSGSTCLY